MAKGYEAGNLLSSKKSLPATFKVGRSLFNRASSIEHNITEGAVTISGLTDKISEYDLTCYTFALAQALYNQSYRSGNADVNSGNARIMSTLEVYEGHLIVTRNELCRYAFGIKNPSSKECKKMDNIIKIVHNTQVKIEMKGRTIERTICMMMDRRTDDKGAVEYVLVLHPLFCQDVANNFAELPQDIMLRLSNVVKRKTTAHIRMLRLLACQDKSKPLTRTIKAIVEYLGLAEAYKINKQRTIKQIKNCLDVMKEIGMLSDYVITDDKIICTFDKAFLPRNTHLIDNKEEG